MTDEPTDEWLLVKDASIRLSVSETAIRSKIARRTLRSRKDNNNRVLVLVSRSSVAGSPTNDRSIADELPTNGQVVAETIPVSVHLASLAAVNEAHLVALAALETRIGERDRLIANLRAVVQRLTKVLAGRRVNGLVGWCRWLVGRR